MIPLNIIYLPIELKDREIEGKVLLATYLINHGYQVLIGQQWEIYNQLENFPPGVIFFKSTNKIHYPAMRKAKKLGHIVIVQDEELMGHTSIQAYNNAFKEEVYDICDYIFAISNNEKEFHSKKADKNKIQIVGNLRVDILKEHVRDIFFKERVRGIQEKYGRYILVNTNFSAINANIGNIQTIFDISVRAGALDPQNPIEIEEFRDMIDWELENVKQIKSFIQHAPVKFPHLNFILRPHPAENVETAINEFRGIKNVYVVREGSHVPWTIGSEMLVHTSCTTGLEATICQKTAISIIARENWLSNELISNKVSLSAKDYSDAIDLIDKSNYKLHSHADVLDYEDYIYNISNKLAVLKMIEFIDSLNLRRDFIRFPKITAHERLPFQKHKCSISLNEINSMIKKISYANKFNINFVDNEVTDSLFYLK